MPTGTATAAATNTVWLGDPKNYGSTAINDGSYTLTGDFDTIGTATNSGCITLGHHYGSSISITPKNGDIEIDGATLKAKIYDTNLNKWMDCEIETMKNKDGETRLEVSYNISAKEQKENQDKRPVLFEKTRKPVVILGGIGGSINLDNIWRNYIVQPAVYNDPIVYGDNLNGNNNLLINYPNGINHYPNYGNLVVGGGSTATIAANPGLTVNGAITLTAGATATNMPVGTIWNNGTHLVVQTNSGTQNLVNLA
jgi:hypothetical protein